jgi:hypothetical protein
MKRMSRSFHACIEMTCSVTRNDAKCGLSALDNSCCYVMNVQGLFTGTSATSDKLCHVPTLTYVKSVFLKL